MSKANASTTDKVDVYSIVTDRIIHFLEQGIVPWHLPWTRDDTPINMISKRAYRGINLWTLLGNRYEQNLFITFDQLKSIGGSIKRGETGHVVAYATSKKKRRATTEQTASDSPILQYYKVFNIRQTVDVPEKFLSRPKETIDPLPFCESIIASIPNAPTIKHKGQQPHYDDIKDIITMPSKKNYQSPEQYYAALFEQMMHSAAHETRLGRFAEADETGSTAFPQLTETVIAEMGASMLCSHAGIACPDKAYTVSLISDLTELLRKDHKFIGRAGAFAQKAVDLILNKNQTTAKDESEEAE